MTLLGPQKTSLFFKDILAIIAWWYSVLFYYKRPVLEIYKIQVRKLRQILESIYGYEVKQKKNRYIDVPCIHLYYVSLLCLISFFVKFVMNSRFEILQWQLPSWSYHLGLEFKYIYDRLSVREISIGETELS